MVYRSYNMEATKRILDKAYHKLKDKDKDFVLLIVGTEGKGKTHLGLNCAEYWCKINPNDKEDINRVGLSADEYIQGIRLANKTQYVMFDEAGDGFYSRDSSTTTSKRMVKLLMVIRGKNLFHILILPSFFDVDVYIRKHRVRGLFLITETGRCSFYDKPRIDEIIRKCEKFKRIFGIKPCFTDTYPKYTGLLSKQYLEKKEKKIEQAIKEANDEITGTDDNKRLTSERDNLIAKMNEKIGSKLTSEIVNLSDRQVRNIYNKIKKSENGSGGECAENGS